MSIQNKMIEYLKPRDFKIDTILGFSDGGDSALILELDKNNCHISIEIGNESKDIRIRGGLIGKYLPKGKQIPKFKQTFKSTEIKAASDFFVKVANYCSDHDTTKDTFYGTEKDSKSCQV